MILQVSENKMLRKMVGLAEEALSGYLERFITMCLKGGSPNLVHSSKVAGSGLGPR
jgi:hypothetical protein